MADPATVVIDNGTGYTKMGYAGNMEPSYLIPSVIAKNVPKVSVDSLAKHISYNGFRGFCPSDHRLNLWFLFTARWNRQERQF